MPLPGFSETQETNAIAIFCNNQKASSWYYRENEENIPLPPRLTATILRIEEWTKPAEGKYDEQQKLTVKVSTSEGHNYNLVMGRSSAFAKGIIGPIVNTPLSVLKQPITISVRPGESALLCSLYSGSDWLEGLKDWKNQDWDALTACAIDKINNQSTSQSIAPPVVPVVETEEETELHYEATFEDEELQSELLPMKSVDELNAEIKGMTINTAPFLLEEIDKDQTKIHLGVNHGGVVARYNKHLSELSQLAEQALTVCKAVGMSAAEAKAKLGGKRDDCTLAKLKTFVASIELPAAEPVDLSEIPF